MAKVNNRTRTYFSIFVCILFNSGCALSKPNLGIVYTAAIDGNQDIYWMADEQPDQIKRLTFTPQDPEKELHVNKTGNRILFYVPGPGVERVVSEGLKPPATYSHTYLLDLNTAQEEEINDTFKLNPVLPLAWVEDQIALFELSSRRVFLVNPEQKNRTELIIPASGKSELVELNYSSDGEQILYTLHNKIVDPSFVTFYYDLQNQSNIQLGDKGANCVHSEWSPTGKQIALLCDLSKDGLHPNYHVSILGIAEKDVSQVQKIADFPQCNDPAWSPDGKQLVMLCIEGVERKIFLANSDGSNFREITRSQASELRHVWEMVWSPNGQQILYVEGEEEELSDIYMMNVDGSECHKITMQPANYQELSVFTIAW